jgi:hypothetical protein
MFPSELKQCYREISEDLRNTLSNYQTIYHIYNEDGDEEALKSHLDFLNEQLVMFVALIKEQDRQIRELP